MFLASGWFDESTDESAEGRCYTVAGFVGALEPAVILELRWKDLLEKYDLAYFKASEIEFGFGEFAKHRDDPSNLSAGLSDREKTLSIEIKTAFVDLIVKEDGILGIGACVVLPDYERIRRDHPEAKKNLPSPYHICAQFTLIEAGQMAVLHNQGEQASRQVLLRPIFDAQEEYGGRMKHEFNSFKRKNPVSSRFLLPPHYEDEKQYLMLQVADCLAYEVRRLLGKQEFEPNRSERKAMTRLKERCRRIYKLNYEGLKIVVDGQLPPDVIPIPPAIENDMALEF